MELSEISAVASCPERVRGHRGAIRSCDSCYATKSRCAYPSHHVPCTRCAKLALTCTDNRPLRTPGPKPPKNLGLAHWPSNSLVGSRQQSLAIQGRDDAHLVLCPCPGPLSAILRTFSGPEVRLVEYAFSSSFIDAYMPFQHGQDELRQVLMNSFLIAPELVKDSLLACAGAVASQRNHNLTDSNTDQNFRRAVNTLVHVRAIRAGNDETVSILLNLATGLATFSNYAIGDSTQSILWHVLSCIANYERDSPVQSILHSNRNIGCLLFMHHFECLVRSEIPAYRVKPANDFPEDRYFGTSFSILPLLFGLCEIAHQIKVRGDTDVHLAMDLENTIDSLMRWKPQPTARFLGTQVERFMTAQARCIQSAAIIMACRYPARLSDVYLSLQHSLRNQIQDEASRMHENLPKQSGNLYVTFPYFVSCLSTPDLQENDQALVLLNQYSNNTAPATCRKMYEFLRFVWMRQSFHNAEPWAVTYTAGPAMSVAI